MGKMSSKAAHAAVETNLSKSNPSQCQKASQARDYSNN